MNLLDTIPYQFLLDPEIEAALMALYEKKLFLQQLEAQKEQEEIAKEFAEAKSIDGVGALKMQVHADAYHQIAQDMGGYEIWGQKDFQKHFLKRAPECRVKCGGTRIQVGFSGEKRFTKTYSSERLDQSGPSKN